MKRRLFTLLLFLAILSANAERIDGPANVRTAPKGTPIISLLDHVEVGCSELENGWYRISIHIQLTKEQHDGVTPLDAGDSLFNWKNEFIGTALAPIPDSLQSTWYSGGAPGNPRRYGMDIYASTYQSNIRPESIPEQRLNRYLESNDEPVKADLLGYLEEFGFENSGILARVVDGYEEQMIYESTLDDPSPMDRIRFIFKAGELVAIVHTRPIRSRFSSVPLTRGRNIILIPQMDDSEAVQFLEWNRSAYEGVD